MKRKETRRPVLGGGGRSAEGKGEQKPGGLAGRRTEDSTVKLTERKGETGTVSTRPFHTTAGAAGTGAGAKDRSASGTRQHTMAPQGLFFEDAARWQGGNFAVESGTAMDAPAGQTFPGRANTPKAKAAASNREPRRFMP